MKPVNAWHNRKNFRIVLPNGSIKYAGTGEDSWFTVEEARKKCNMLHGEKVYEFNGSTRLWEIL